MVRQQALFIQAEAVENADDFFVIPNAEAAFSYGVFRRQLVKAQREGFAEQPGKTLGKFRAGRDDPDFRSVEGVAVKQNAVAFRNGKATPVKTDLSAFGFYF